MSDLNSPDTSEVNQSPEARYSSTVSRLEKWEEKHRSDLTGGHRRFDSMEGPLPVAKRKVAEYWVTVSGHGFPENYNITRHDARTGVEMEDMVVNTGRDDESILYYKSANLPAGQKGPAPIIEGGYYSKLGDSFHEAFPRYNSLQPLDENFRQVDVFGKAGEFLQGMERSKPHK